MVQIEGLPSRYTIESLLGEGGFGKVFRVRDSHRKEFLALKVLSQDSANVRASLMKEFKILAGLRHPNLIRVHDFGYLSPRLFYFTMEYLEGADLRLYLSQKEHISQIPAILEQLLDALVYLHRNRVVHGDIKPENIMIVQQGGTVLTKLLDFGLTSSGRDSKQITVSGTPRFLAPEILTAGARKGPATDIYALGASLLESILGEQISPPTEVTEQALKRQTARLGNALAKGGIKNPSILASYITDLCMPEPDQRPESAEAAVRSYQTLLSPSGRLEEAALGDVFVDRKDELAAIASFLKRTSSEQRILVIRGPRGVGKKTLLRRTIQAQQLKRRVFIDLGATSFDHLSIEDISRTIASQLGSSDRALFSAKASFIRKRAQSLRAAKATENIASKSLALFDHLIEGLHDISLRSSLGLLIPDADRLGKDYCRFVDHVANFLESAESNIKLLVTINTDAILSDDSSRLISKLASREYTRSLEIEGFSDRTLKSYLQEMFNKDLLSDSEVNKINLPTQGLPLLIEILLRQLIGEKVFRVENGEWIFDRSAFARRRASLHSDKAFAAEFDRIPARERTALKLLAFIDQGIPARDFATIAKGIIDDSQEATDALLTRAILRRDSTGTIGFAHPLYKAVALSRSKPEEKERLNAAIAEHLSRTDTSNSLIIARHYIAAGNVTRALRLGLEAADNLYAAYMPYDCLALLGDLIILIGKKGTSEQYHQVLTRLAPIQYQTGLLKNAQDSYEELIKWEQTFETKARYMIHRAILLGRLGDDDKSIQSLHKTLSFCRVHHQAHLIPEIYYLLGEISHVRGVYYLQKAVKLSRDLDSNLHMIALARLCYRHKISGNMKLVQNEEKQLIKGLPSVNDEAKKEILRGLASIHLHGGEYKLHKYFLDQKMEIERRQDDTLGLIRSLTSLGGYYYAVGDYAALIDTLRETLSLSIRYNQRLTAITSRFNLILAYRMMGDYGRSLHLAIGLEEFETADEKLQIGAISYIKPAQLYGLLGEAMGTKYRKAIKLLHKAAGASANTIGLGHYNMCYSTYHQINERYRESLGFAEKAIALFTKAEDRDDIVLALVQKAIVLAMLGKTGEAAKSATKANNIYEEIHCEYLKPFLMLGRGMIARIDGESAARALLADGLRTSKKMGTREITWQLQRELALYHRDRGEVGRAMEYYQDAVDTLKQITETLDEEQLRVSYLQVPIRKRVFDEIKELRAEIRRSS